MTAGEGGERAAAITGLVTTATLNGRDPETCPRAVLNRIADHPLHQVADLLPRATVP